jgi:hypothetical protein
MKLFDPWSRMLRRMHYAQNMDGMYNRYMRERKGWDVHLRKTRNFITDFVNHQPEHRKVVILGSGWLLDIPIELLIDKYKEIYLADILHPPQVKHKYRKIASIHWIETDLSGGYMKGVYELVGKKGGNLSAEELSSLQPLPEKQYLDLGKKDPNENVGLTHFISVNLLSQLDGMLIDYLQEHTRIKPEQLLNFRRKIQQDHLDFLKNAGPACLVTDFSEIRQPLKTGAALETRLILADWPDVPHQEQWKWAFDSTGSYLHEYTVSMLVKATSL